MKALIGSNGAKTDCRHFSHPTVQRLLDTVCLRPNFAVKVARYWSLKGNKKRTMRSLFSHLDKTSLVNKGFIIWQKLSLLSRDKTGDPERARKAHFVRWEATQNAGFASYHTQPRSILIKLINGVCISLYLQFLSVLGQVPEIWNNEALLSC